MSADSEKRISFSKRVWELIDDGANTTTQLVDKFGAGERSRIGSALQNLVQRGKIVRTGYGTFAKIAAQNGNTQNGKHNGKLAIALHQTRAPIKTSKPMRVLGLLKPTASVGKVITALEKHIELRRAELSGFEQALRIVKESGDKDTDEPP